MERPQLTARRQRGCSGRPQAGISNPPLPWHPTCPVPSTPPPHTPPHFRHPGYYVSIHSLTKQKNFNCFFNLLHPDFDTIKLKHEMQKCFCCKLQKEMFLFSAKGISSISNQEVIVPLCLDHARATPDPASLMGSERGQRAVTQGTWL